jgi:hypothetical protein
MPGHPAIVVGTGGEPAATPAAREWQDRLDQIAPGRFLVMMQVMAGGARTSSSGSFRARLRDAYGQWAVLEASPLIGGDEDQVAVTIEPARGDHLMSLLMTAYGLTAREREICSEVIGLFHSRYRWTPVHFQQHRARSLEVDLQQGRCTQSRRACRSASTEWVRASSARVTYKHVRQAEPPSSGSCYPSHNNADASGRI